MKNKLTAAQRETLEQDLLARRTALDLQVQARRHGLSLAEQALATREEDGDDASQLATEREIESALTDIERRERLALANALTRVREPGYGLCSDCGAGIPFGRLQVEPQALRCVACESRHEKRES